MVVNKFSGNFSGLSPQSFNALQNLNLDISKLPTNIVPVPGYQLSKYYESLNPTDKADIDKQMFQSEYGGMGAATMSDFNTLLSKLEQSKINQQSAAQASARPGIYAKGLSNMMANF